MTLVISTLMVTLSSACRTGFSSAQTSPALISRTEQRPVIALDLSGKTPKTMSLLLHRADGSVDSTLLRNTLGATWSPSGNTIAAISADTLMLRVARLIHNNGARDTITIAEEGWRIEPAWPAWSPGGDSVAFMVAGATMRLFGRQQLVIVHVAQRAVVARIPLTSNVLGGGYDAIVKARWSPDGKGMLICGIKRCIVTDIPSARAQSSGGSIIADWSPDGKRLLYFTFRNTNPYDGTRLRPSVASFTGRIPGTNETVVIADSIALERAGYRPFPFYMEGVMELSRSGRKLVVAMGGIGRADSIGVRIFTANASGDFDILKPDTTHWTVNLPLQFKWSQDEKSIVIAEMQRGDDFLAFTRMDVATGLRHTIASYKMEGMTAMYIGAQALVSW